MNRRKRNRRVLGLGVTLVVVMLIIIVIVVKMSSGEEREKQRLEKENLTKTTTSVERRDETPLEHFISEHRLSMNDYPDKLLDLLERNPETEEYVLNYPLKKDSVQVFSLEDCVNTAEVPHLYQWDERWGYMDYGGELMGLSGCGPTALSMVCLYLLDDPVYTPAYIAEYSVEQGYRVKDNGTSWTLMSEGARDFGLNVEELKLSRSQVMKNLEVGNPIICVVGPGTFTETGHFIVLVGEKEGKIRINDPNSPEKSEKLWDFDDFSDQIKNIWAYNVTEE